MKRIHPPVVLLPVIIYMGKIFHRFMTGPESHRYKTSHDEICVDSPQQQDIEQGCDTDKRAKLHRTL